MRSSILGDSINHKTMRSAVLEYRQTNDLEAHERAALAGILDHVRDKRILDMGVGADPGIGNVADFAGTVVGEIEGKPSQGKFAE